MNNDKTKREIAAEVTLTSIAIGTVLATVTTGAYMVWTRHQERKMDRQFKKEQDDNK